MIGISREQRARIWPRTSAAPAPRARSSAARSAIDLTISIGFTVTRGETDLAKIMRVADQALYMAKRQGRDRVIRADEATLAAA